LRQPTTDNSTSSLLEIPHGATQSAAAKSQYQQNKGVAKLPTKVDQQKICQGCGKQSHPEGKPLNCRFCPARNLVCNGCGNRGHMKAICRKTKGDVKPSASGAIMNATSDEPQEDAWSTLFAQSSPENVTSHVEWDNGSFKEQPPRKLPRVQVRATVM